MLVSTLFFFFKHNTANICSNVYYYIMYLNKLDPQ